MTDDTEERRQAIEELIGKARTTTKDLQHHELCPTHGPAALLGAAYLSAARQAGMTDIECIARLHWTAAVSRQVERKAKAH